MSNDDGMRNAPDWLKWTMTFINRVGFPIMVALYLMYIQMKAFPALTQAMNSVNQTLGGIQTALQDNTELLKTWKDGHGDWRRR